jgi:hypothetical protein
VRDVAQGLITGGVSVEVCTPKTAVSVVSQAVSMLSKVMVSDVRIARQARYCQASDIIYVRRIARWIADVFTRHCRQPRGPRHALYVISSVASISPAYCQ